MGSARKREPLGVPRRHLQVVEERKPTGQRSTTKENHGIRVQNTLIRLDILVRDPCFALVGAKYAFHKNVSRRTARSSCWGEEEDACCSELFEFAVTIKLREDNLHPDSSLKRRRYSR